jgi:hypothetical protein
MLIRVHLDHVTFPDRSVSAIEEAWGIGADGVPSPDPGPDAAVALLACRNASISFRLESQTRMLQRYGGSARGARARRHYDLVMDD